MVCLLLMALLEGSRGEAPVGDSLSSTPALAAVVNRSAPAADVAFAQSCAGSLVGPDLILTAAHCVQDRPATGLDVIIGANNLCSGAPIGGERTHVLGVLFPPPAMFPAPPDAAILVLENDSSVEPLRLAPMKEEVGISLGWGKDKPAGSPVCSRRLARLASTGPSECVALAAAARRSFSAEHHLCLRPVAGSRNTCAGDSGGPILQRREHGLALVGLTSWGSCERGDVGVYVRADQLQIWLRQVRREHAD